MTSKIHIEIISKKPVDARLNDKYVKNWMEQIGNERTKNNYAREFPRFLEFVNRKRKHPLTPKEIIESRLKHLTSTDLGIRVYWEQKLIKYMHDLEKANLRVATIHGYLRSVQSFFSHNGVKLQFARNMLKPQPTEAEKVYRKWVATNPEVRAIYRMCKTPRDRALILVLYQSGFSPVDVSNMKIEDFPFYNEKQEWNLKPQEHLYHMRRREKTNVWQETCISFEALEDIKMMLELRGKPKEGSLFIGMTKRKIQLAPREINDVVKRIIRRTFPNRIKEWKTKNLRDSYKNGLVQAKLSQEIIDCMFGHQRKGARKDYQLTEPTTRMMYEEAFKYLRINGFSSTTRIEELAKEFKETKSELAEQIAELRQQNKLLEKALSTKLGIKIKELYEETDETETKQT